ncbi:amino acid ABC transporter substrate-binding protein [Streptomyces iconiensis]|uniref:Amino acid ABC transporter substrate-binding protein n=1 Tax=Streptomyces iconiensis TaxID=1384038 RepID=A0ABT7AAI8_9ACTN|nr:amino acid ABC transporter substrate-binding protein [Streptomyces iconiensis]MDJ1138345.1 amino acid ABC transporter substrate-binding protein [Streptomyces iconiensis]
MFNWFFNVFWANGLRKALTVVLALALVGGGGYVIREAVVSPDLCADGVEKSGGECVGTNGSGYDFGTPEIRKVAGAIAKENRRVAAGPHITVAVMLPLQPDIQAERRQLRSELQGAYLAQYRANRQEEEPKMRLVLANPGDDYRQHARVVDRLAEMADSTEDNLRAVTGFNLSLTSTRDVIDRLTNDLKIPVLASRVTADELANLPDATGKPRFDGLARVIPTNHKQADALAEFHRDLKDKDTVLVRDTRRGDIYVDSLASAFGRPEKGPPGSKDQEFTSPGITKQGDTGNDFALIGHNICQSQAKIVYFAGRPVHLRLFALKLAAAPCGDKSYTIVSGSGAATLDRYMSAADWRELRGTEPGKPAITVEYAAPAHPDAWDVSLRDWEKERKKATGKKPGEAGRPAYLTEPQRELAALRALITKESAGDIGPVRLDDSRTMLVHDGVHTIAQAVFLANARAAGSVPPRERVAAQWPRLDSAHRVRGTSGWICLTNGGNPYNKPVAVVRLDPRTRKVAFSGLAWPEGRPQPPGCVVPSGTG